MKAVLMSINSLNNANIESGAKGSELRTRPPKLKTPFKVYTYESGSLGRHKVVNEWICKDIITWLMYMGIPTHLSKVACVSNEYIWNYCDKGNKNIGEMRISDLVIYDKPKELSEFWQKGGTFNSERDNIDDIKIIGREVYKPITRPPQSWCYVEEVQE